MTDSGDRDGSDDAMRKRLAELSRDLSRGDATRGGPRGEPPPDKGMGQAISVGVRATSEFVAAVAVGGLIGWQLDQWLHSSPIAIIVFLALGTAAGFWNVYRVAMKTGGK